MVQPVGKTGRNLSKPNQTINQPMQYNEIKLTITPAEPWKDIFTSMMADAGCDSFMDGENDNELLCYIPVKD